MRQWAMLVVLATGLAVAADEKKDEKAGKENGTWSVVSVEVGGEKKGGELKATLTIKDNAWTLKIGDMVTKGTSKVDLTKTPAELDVTETEGPNKGRILTAIVEIKGDTMRACYNLTGKERPKEFSTKDKPGYALKIGRAHV